ncbi:MAG: lamin tail domain-containing protein [Bacteroidales bacterium]|jgi:hypothetical protein|nr:lamin tail domain-containing protein [Bacteroidales bacterium]
MRTLVYVLLCCPLSLFAQWNEDFSDGVLTRWQGNTGKFTTDAGWLQLNDNAAGIAYLSTASDVATDASWEFVVRLTFNPTSGNYTKVYLMANQIDMTGALDGYFVRVGHTADNVCLFRQEGTTETQLIAGRNKLLDASSVQVRIKVTRDAQGEWALMTQLSSEPDFVTEGAASDHHIRESAYFGLVCVYTATNRNRFYFDDFRVDGQPYADRDAPEVVAVSTVNGELQIAFSEPVTTTRIWREHFTADDILPDEAIADESRKNFTLRFPENFPCGVTCRLSVSGFADTARNAMRDTMLYFSIPCVALPRDIVINEVMANPSGVVQLSEHEYVELYNRSGKNIEMEGWTFTYGNTTKTFPPYLFPSGSYLLLVHPDAEANMAAYGTTLPILGSQTAIANAGQYLLLSDIDGTPMSWIDFDVYWYSDELKQDGGWSLEQIDTEQPCTMPFNWQASSDRRGGTPGAVNSVATINTDAASPRMQRIAVRDSHTIELYASKPFGYFSPDFSIDPDLRVINVQIAGKHFDRLQLTLDTPLQDGQWYELSTSGNMTDCAGYAFPPAFFRFSTPQFADNQDIIINEVLFQATSDGYTFIELYNRSQKTVRVSDLQLSMRNADGNLSSPVALTEEPFLLMPGQYIVVSRNVESVMQQYRADNAECFLRMAGMPQLTRESGRLVLLDKSLQVLDEIHYHNMYHVDFLKTTAGVSLERLHPDRNSLEPSNWHTAAQTAGFATPGRQNSQYVETESAHNSVVLQPEVFSPDNNGVDDVLNICYRLETSSLTVDVIIFDSSGRRVRQLLRQQLPATEGVISWDGYDESHRKSLTGIYLVYFHAYNSAGFNRLFKLPCVLAAKKN